MTTMARRRRAPVPNWARNVGKKISAGSRGLAEVLTRLAEPAMRYSALYLALQMAPPLSFLRWAPAIGVATAVVIAGPEFALLGALNVMEDAIRAEDGSLKFWGWILAFICLLLAGIMIVTFADIFKVITLQDGDLNTLSFARCLIAVFFGIVLGKLDQDDDEGNDTSSVAVAPTIGNVSLPGGNATTNHATPQSGHATPDHVALSQGNLSHRPPASDATPESP